MTQEDPEEAGGLAEPELDRVVYVRTGRDRFRTDIGVRGHPLVVDEPVALGGGDLGPTPYDLLCAALGACITITVRMYADRKAWPLEEITASVSHRREAGGEHDTSVDWFRVEIGLRGALEAEQRARLLEIASRCPVHRTLAAGSRIEAIAAPS